MSNDQFKENLLATIQEAGIVLHENKIKFIITPIKEENVKYNSIDDSTRLWMLSEANLKDRFFTLSEVIDFLALPNQKFPIWIKVFLKDKLNGDLVFELQTSMRYRTPTQLKHVESGHPPFIYVSNGGNVPSVT